MECSSAFSVTTENLCEVTGITPAQISQWSDAVQEIHWDKAKFIGGGVFATVFDIGNGCVVKVGRITPAEAALSDIMADEGLGVKMYGYEESVVLPEEIARDNCPVHGKARNHRNNIENRLYWGTFECTCNQPQSVMILEKGELISDEDARKIEWEMDGVNIRAERVMKKHLSKWFDDIDGLHADRHRHNLVTVDGEVRAIDFGLLCDETGEPPLGITEDISLTMNVVSYALTRVYDSATARNFDRVLRGNIQYPPDSFGNAAPLVAVALLRSWGYGAEDARRLLLADEQPWRELRELAGDTELVQSLIERSWIDPEEYVQHAQRIAEHDPDLAGRMQRAAQEGVTNRQKSP